MEVNAKVNYGNLKSLIKEMSKQYSVKVGILGELGAQEVSENMDMAGLGYLHEYGCDIKITPKMAAYLHFKAEELGLPPSEGKGDGYIHIPARSWLQMPILSAEGTKAIKNAVRENISNDKELNEYIFKNNPEIVKKIAKAIGAAAFLRILEAFETDGFGEWPANSPYTVAQKGSAMPLVDTGSLKRSITYEVEER